MKRELALKWWRSLPFDSSNNISMTSLFKKYFTDTNRFTPAQNYTQLTGREIEWMWEQENNKPLPF